MFFTQKVAHGFNAPSPYVINYSNWISDKSTSRPAANVGLQIVIRVPLTTVIVRKLFAI